MAIRFFNTLTLRKEEFEPLQPGKVGMYTCGPTVYNYAHIGNFRSYMFEDLLRRHLAYRGFDVKHIMNITDVDDKIIRTCRETGESLESVTGRYTKAFLEDIEALGIQRAHEYPTATGHVPEMIDLIKTLREKGHTYEVDGSTYFRIASFPDYGKLSHKDLEGLQVNASGRIDTDEYEVEDARDFALWKAYDEDDGAVFWETDIGKGRPGWHTECVCMSMKYLGRTFDIHCGGVDLTFPHHENEIAQAECATDQPFARYWLHHEHLIVEGRKMSKSLGNVYTIRDILDKGYSPLAVRWVLIATHYRQRLNFSWDALEAATESLRRIQDFRRRLADVTGDTGDDLSERAVACEEAFGAALDDDLNISGALATVFEFIRDVNRLIDERALSQAGAERAVALLDRLDEVVGVLGAGEAEEAPAEILALVNERQEARRSKDFARADAIRDQLAAGGWVIEDTPEGPRVKRN